MPSCLQPVLPEAHSVELLVMSPTRGWSQTPLRSGLPFERRLISWAGKDAVARTAKAAAVKIEFLKHFIIKIISVSELLRLYAGEILRFINATAALVARNLRIDTQRPGAIHFFIHDAAGNNLLGAFTGFDPIHEGRRGVEHARAHAAAAVEHSR